jgi:hypothetical protein
MQGFHCRFSISYSINGFFIFRFCNHLYIDSVISEGFEYQAVDLGVVSHTNSHQKKLSNVASCITHSSSTLNGTHGTSGTPDTVTFA